MALAPCPLPHALHLVIESGRFQRAAEEYPRSIPPNRSKVKADLDELSAFGVPTFLDTGRDGEPQITFCTPRYEIVGGLTHKRDGYYIYRISPLSLRSHNQIARRAVAVMPRRWQLHREVWELSRVVLPRTGFRKIQAAWQHAREIKRPRPQPSGPSLAHLSFLSDVETLIDLACQVELNQAANRASTPVVRVEPVARARSAGDFYRFILAGPTDLKVSDYAWAGVGVPGERGPGYACVVTEATEESLTVHFNRPVDLARLRRVEWLMPWVSTKQYDIQEDAVRALRQGDSLNPYVLPVIVDGRFERYEAPIIHEAKEMLNPAQRTMIARANSAPDLLLALGPPGTGKTHTIRAIVGQQARQGKKVLITSKNNKAVDNVLEALEGVEALRIGREEAVSAEVRPLMIDERARELQAQILGEITPRLEKLKSFQVLWDEIQRVLDSLNTCADNWRMARARYTRTREDLQAWQRARYADVSKVIERQTRRFEAERARAFRAARRANALSQRMDRLSTLCELPLVGAAFVIWWARLDERWQAVSADYQQALEGMRVIRDRVRQIEEAYRKVAIASDDALRYKRTIVEAEQTLAQLCTEAEQGVSRLREMIGNFVDAPSLKEATKSPEALEASRWQLQDWHKAVERRRDLLQDWHGLLQTRRQALYSVLIRMADVVGATCIGVATDSRFEDLEFDLMIADEAGQIQVMDLLVPLVRARRAVLVGDHLQLPPVVEHEIAERIDPDDDALHDWLKKSLFEHLFKRETAPDSHTIMLDTQYRMPRVIADFISQRFYDGHYNTGRDVPHTDPFFDTPMVFVDTKRERDRRERPGIEPEGVRGYMNDLEARVIADLVLAYRKHGAEWGVIVPYKKQADLIRQVLMRRHHALPKDQLQDWVATVDSFQGKERDVIIYGFTRSNAKGRVGFLSELRRLNVSLTRARHQLVMIGDSLTLTRATHRPFAELIKSLLKTTQELSGGYLHVRDLRPRLKR